MIESPIHIFAEQIDFALEDVSRSIDWLVDSIRDRGSEIDEVNIIFCSDEYLLQVNREHLDHDYYTDIITFPYEYDPIKADLFISVDRIRDNAQEYGADVDTELHRVMLHGLLHMAGLGDKSPEEEKAMRAAENHYLTKWSELKKK